MKRAILFLHLIVICTAAIAQSFQPNQGNIIPLEEYHDYIQSNSTKTGDYLKDVNGVLDKYIGTWQGSINNKTYTFEISKSIYVGRKLKIDMLVIKHKIIEASTRDPYVNTLNITEEDDLIVGRLFDKENPKEYELTYGIPDNERDRCGDVGDMFIEAINNNTQLIVYVVPLFMMFDGTQNCPNGYFEPPFPDKDETPLILTKQ